MCNFQSFLRKISEISQKTPQILSIEPRSGSVDGGTLLTIKGTGFTTDGLGGTVNVLLGDDECAIETMTETEIKCRTLGKAEESAPPMENKVFTMIPESGNAWTSKFHRNKFELGTARGQVETMEQCRELCRKDATCLAFMFYAGETWDGCYHIDYLGDVATDAGLDAYLASDAFSFWNGTQTGYVKFSDRSGETNCFTGRGEMYSGDLDVTKEGEKCRWGTKCRNANPSEYVRPHCTVASGEVQECNVVRCDAMFGKYAGNRGATVQWGTFRTWQNRYINHDSAWLDGPTFTNLDGRYSISKYGGFYNNDINKNADGNPVGYNMFAKNYFVAPFDGLYTFHLSGNDASQMWGNHNEANGGFEKFAEYHWYCNPSRYGCDYKTSISRQVALKKGEKLALDARMNEGTRTWEKGDYLRVSVGYHGEDERGTRYDHMDKDDALQETIRKHILHNIYQL